MNVQGAMLMAAGLGTRLRPFTDVCPKPLLPMLDVPMAQFAVDALLEAGVSRIVANVHHRPTAARSGLQKLDIGEASLILSDESDLLLGSAGGIRKALGHFEGPFFLLNSDVITDVDLAALARAHARFRARFGARMTLALTRLSPEAGVYREISWDVSSGLITGCGDLVAGRPFFSGAAVLEPEALAGVPVGPADFREVILRPAIAERSAGAIMMEGLWCDVGTPELWRRAHLSLIERLETGNLSGRLRRRLDTANRRVAQGLWVSRRASQLAGFACGTRWESPAYWAPQPGGVARQVPPLGLPSGTILYGAIPAERASGSGIGFDGNWFGREASDK